MTLRAYTEDELDDRAIWGPGALDPMPRQTPATSDVELRCAGCQRLGCHGACEPGLDYGHAKGWY